MKDLMNKLKELNEIMRGFGFANDISLKNNTFEITESEVIMKLPYSLKLSIPKKDFEGDDKTITQAVSQAISQAVSLNK